MLFNNKTIANRCFCYPKKYWYRNVKNIPLYFKQVRFLKRSGYDSYALWETFDWFIVTMRKILYDYRKSHKSYPILTDNYFRGGEDAVKENRELWNSTIDRMISLLNVMDEKNPVYDDMDLGKRSELQEKAKNEFFELFSKHFYELWD